VFYTVKQISHSINWHLHLTGHRVNAEESPSVILLC